MKRAHGEPVSFLTADWVSLLREFKQQRGKIQDSELPAQSNYEAFEESLHDGTIQAETLSHVVSIAEEQKQRAGRPEPPKATGTAPRLNINGTDEAPLHVIDASHHRSSAYEV